MAALMKGVSKAIVCIFSVCIIFSGCFSLVKGEFFLSARQYEEGESIFQEEVRSKPDNDENWYYLGRFMLAQEKYGQANSVLKKAVEMNPYEARYHFWLGISYGGIGKTDAEISSYKKTIDLDPDHSQAYTYLGHCYLRQKKYDKALESYAYALTYSENNPSAIYNQALIFYRTKSYDNARKRFKTYLEKYGSSPKAFRAVDYLNRMGDFNYRVHLINKKKIILEKLAFVPDKRTLTLQSRESLAWVADMMQKNSPLELYVLVYEKNDITLAKKKAVQIKNYMETYFSQLQRGRVKISFFGEPEKIRMGKRNFLLDSSINLFAVPKDLIK